MPQLGTSVPKLRGEGVGTLNSFVNGLGKEVFDLAGVLMSSNSADGPAFDEGEEWTVIGLPSELTPLMIGLGPFGINMLNESSRVGK